MRVNAPKSLKVYDKGTKTQENILHEEHLYGIFARWIRMERVMMTTKSVLIVFFLLFSLVSPAFSTHPFNIIQEEIRIPLRDGVKLGATLFRPDQDGKYPALLMRTPYSKDDYISSSDFPLKAAKAGYLVVVVDVRGRYTSEGNFKAYHQEKEDGYDVIEWVAQSSYCNGKVGTYGRSYPGFVQWLALSEGPPSLKAAVPEMTPIHSHQFFYVGGAFSYAWFDWFVPLILPDLRRRALDTSGPWDEATAAGQWNSEKRKWYEYRPLGENPLLRKYAPYYYEWLAHPERTVWWNFANAENDFGKMKAPGFLVSGWDDSAYGPLGAAEGFRKKRKETGSLEARGETRMILGPWNHSRPQIRTTRLGLLDSGPSGRFGYDAYLFQWFDQNLKGKAAEEPEPPVSIFVMGASRWRYEQEWPLSRAEETGLYLHKATLSRALPGSEKPDTFTFDPETPLWDPTYEQSFPFDQREIEARKDVLVYTSEPLEQDM